LKVPIVDYGTMLHRMQQAEPNHMLFYVCGFPTKKSDLLSRFPQKIVALPIFNYLKHSILLNVKELKMKKGLRGKKPQKAMKEGTFEAVYAQCCEGYC
jgi:hypothetical protein